MIVEKYKVDRIVKIEGRPVFKLCEAKEKFRFISYHSALSENTFGIVVRDGDSFNFVPLEYQDRFLKEVE